MANFRLERLFVILDEPVPGIDHLKAVDPVEFAWHLSNEIAEQLGVTPFDEFTYAPFQRPKWHEPDEGLKTARGLLDQYRKWLEAGTNPYMYPSETLKNKIIVLEQVEDVLTAASSLDRQFYLAAKDLE
jgi:hypothetical protein